MSLHPSLKIDSAGAQQRSVMTRIERIKDLMKKGLWNETQKATGLPKIKVLKIKAKKKVAKEEDAAAAGAAAPGAAPAAAPGAKAAAPAAKAAAPAAKK
ncbi:MAG: small basic protein [Candidatus Omnitrophota bacterium]|nr:small basic protein [Candidatus Omnitrophota bacterium]MDZ4242324.1 small basic protein [Candidatus Omnitrophota bacterium]